MPNNTPAGAQQRACSWLQHNLSTTMCRALIVLAKDPRKRHPEGVFERTLRAAVAALEEGLAAGTIPAIDVANTSNSRPHRGREHRDSTPRQRPGSRPRTQEVRMHTEDTPTHRGRRASRDQAPVTVDA